MIIFIQFQVLLLAKVQVHERLLLPSAADLEPDGREHRHARDHDRLEVAPAPVAAGRLLADRIQPCVVAREVFNSPVSHLTCVSVLQFAAQLLSTQKNVLCHLNLRFNLQFKGVHNDKWVSNGHRPPKK